MQIRVNPTRMELLKLKKRVTMAKRGHRLLKDKRDQLMKEFLILIRKNKALRDELEGKLSRAFRSFLIASAMMSSEVMEEALMYSKGQVAIDVQLATKMGVTVPKFHLDQGEDQGEAYSYGFVGTSSELDVSLGIFAEALPLMLQLSEVEKAVELMADEIEKTRRPGQRTGICPDTEPAESCERNCHEVRRAGTLEPYSAHEDQRHCKKQLATMRTGSNSPSLFYSLTKEIWQTERRD